MKKQPGYVERIPVVLYGEPSKNAYLFVHGSGGHKEEGAAFAEIACLAGYQVLAIDLPEHGERRGGQDRLTPWTVVPEMKTVFTWMKSRWSGISVRANSIGAHFAMLALGEESLDKALFVSPIVDMELLIRDMMGWAGVTEAELRSKGSIPTDFGQTLSWDYLTWERRNSIKNWCCPTNVLYAGQDQMTSRETVERFAADHAATLTVMENGEHWFHTPEQLTVLRAWERENL